jgi:hypothetical protein
MERNGKRSGLRKRLYGFLSSVKESLSERVAFAASIGLLWVMALIVCWG